jgi:acetoin utilization protein AcuB
MLVKNWMSKEVITADVNDSLQHATSLMKRHRIKTLPVLEEGRLAGIVTEGDLKEALKGGFPDVHELISQAGETKIKEVMNREVVTVSMDATIEDCAALLLEKDISGAPVVNLSDELKGFITHKDILRVLLSLSGVKHRGMQIGFQLANRPGAIKEVTDIVRDYGCRIVSILSTFDDQSGYRIVYLRLCNCDRSRLEDMKTRLRSAGKMLYLVDHREHKHEHYEAYDRPASEWFVG